ncbi:MAG: SulP family inorganic anion transporter [Verrucomicrobia bacterium]|nr:SulP family inorganic anion transporter [Verrucomicrobiota bacterium]
MRWSSKNEAPRQASPSALLRWVPGLALFRDYRREWFGADLLAGVSVCVVMIPSVIAYAGLMGLPPQHGLYAALIPLIVYPFFGSSRQMIVGPDIAISLLIASAIAPLAVGDPARAAALAATVAVLSGLLLLLGARARIGAIADFLSKPVLVGYMTGAALILMVSQLDKLFGVRLEHNDFFPRLAELAGKLHQAHGTTLLFGLTVLAVIVSLRRLAPKIPPALVVVAAAIGASLALRLEGRGVAVVGAFPGGLPGFALPAADWRDIHTVLPAAIGIALLTYTEGILLARAFAAKNGYEVNPNQELSALGLADVFTGLFQGFSVTGSQSRTTINDSAGGKTQMASLFAAATLILFLLFLTQLIARLPVVALAALLIYGGFTLVEFDVMLRIYRFYPRSALLAALTTLGVLAVGVVPGILVGVALSLLALIERVSNPPDAVLRIAPGGGFHDLGEESQGQTIPGFIAYRFYAPLLFSNASHFVERVRGLIAASPVPVRWFLVDAQAITDIDITAAEALRALNKELHQQGIALKFAHTNRPLRKVLERIGFTSEIGRESIFHAVHEAADAFQKS